LGVPMFKTPNLSASYRGVRQANTSISQPLQLLQFTCMIHGDFANVINIPLLS
jgi:hypothetical protein